MSITGKYKGAAHSVYNLRYNLLKQIPIVFHNGWNYDYHFIITGTVKEFKIKFSCLRKGTKKYITFSVHIENKAKN